MREIALSGKKYPGLSALVDDSDYERIAKHRWWADKRKTLFYARARINGRLVYMHRLLRPDLPGIDHADGNGLNNQRKNLREATQLQQVQNAQGDINKRSCAYKGVFVTNRARNPWRVQIRTNGKRVHVGVFPTPEDAARAYDAAARKAFGEYARTNFER